LALTIVAISEVTFLTGVLPTAVWAGAALGEVLFIIAVAAFAAAASLVRGRSTDPRDVVERPVVLVLVGAFLARDVWDDAGSWYLGTAESNLSPHLSEFMARVCLMPLAEEIHRYAWFVILWRLPWPVQVAGAAFWIITQSVDHAQAYGWVLLPLYLMYFVSFSLLTWWTRRPWWAFVVHAYSNTQLALLHLVVANG
jgi:hypothetical protein